MTLRARLTAAFVLVVLVPLLVVLTLAVTALPSVFAERQAMGLGSSGRLASAVVAELCTRARASAEAAGRAYDGTDAGLVEVLDDLVANGLADGVRVVDADGGTVAAAGSAPDAPPAEDCTSGATWRAGDRLQVAAAVVLERSGRPAGTAVAGFDVDDALATRLRQLVGSGEVVLLAAGEPVARSGSVSDEVLRRSASSPDVPVRTADDVAVALPAVNGRPVGVLLVERRGPGVGLLPLLGFVVLAVAGAGAIALLTARAAVRPLDELTEAAASVAQGDLSVEIKVRGADEVGRLGMAFNAMTEDLRTYVGALQDSRDELQAGVARLGDTLSGTHDLDRILGVVLDAAMASTRAQAGAVVLLSADRTELELVVEQGLRERGVPVALRLPLDAGVVGRVASSGEPVLGRVGDGPGDLRTEPGEPTGRTLIAVPLTSSSTVIGVLVLVDRLGDGEFGERDLSTLRTFTSQATVAVDNVLLHQEARRLSITDGLTGLWNYRYFQMTVSKEIERAARFDRPLALLMLDLDHFKRVNDNHGHQRGDAVLVELAARLRGQVRDVDTLARYGGEEFVAVLPETDQVGASHAAERIRTAVGSQSFGGPGETPLDLTLSIGIAVFPAHGLDASSLLQAADDALYSAKRSGRDAWRLAVGAEHVEQTTN